MASDLVFLEAPLLPRTLRMSSSSTSSSGISRLDEGHHNEHHSTYFLTAMHKSRELAEQISAALTISRGEKRGNDVEEERRFQQQVRRQGLVRGRKTSRFSMDPTTRSQKPENLKSFLKDKHIAADPEEYFATIKRNELAERELKKLKGELDENPINDDVQRTRRQRRPGLPQRGTSLKHFSSLFPETNNPGILKPTIHKEYTSHGNYNSLANISQVLETTTSQLHNFAVAEADKENMGKNPIDMLLSTYDKLDDHEGVALLQEYLQLKPIVLDKLHLPVTPPDTPDAQTASSRSTASDVALTLLQKPVLQTDTLIDPYAWSDTLLPGKPSNLAKDGFFDDASPHHIDIPRPNLPAEVMDDTSTSLRRESFGRILKFPSSEHLSDSGTSIPPIKTGSGPTSKNETIPDECAVNTSTCLTDKTTDDASDKTDCTIGVNSPTICRSKEKSDVMPLEPSIHNQLGETLEGLDCETTNPAEGEECHRTMDHDQMPAVDVNPSNAFMHMENKMDKAMHEEPDQQQGMQFNFRSDDMPLEPSIHNELGERSDGLDCEATNPAEGEGCHRTMDQDQDQIAAVDVNPSNTFVHMKDKMDKAMHEEPDQQQGMQFNFRSDDMQLEPSIHNELGERSDGLDCEATNPAEGEGCHRTMDQDQDQIAAVDVNPSNTFVHMKDKMDKAMHEEPDQQQGMQFNFRSDDMQLEPSIHNELGERSEGLDCEATNPAEGEECHRTMDQDQMAAVDVNPSNAFVHMKDKIDMVMHEEPDRQQGIQDQSSTAMDTTPVEAGCQENSSIAEEHNKQIASGEAKQKARRQLKQRISRGKSLAGGGTTWDCGLRRSTRMKFRPLEHWRGERLLYGRIHDSLATVIGVKCSSPGGSGLKVKSYVPDEYAELVELAALH